MDYKTTSILYKTAVEDYLNRLFTDKNSYQIIYDSIRYSLLSGGKRLRPILTLEVARLGGIDWHEAIPYACALEMIHTYSLIHDDLPCMDNDELRRGKATNHIVYGDCIAVLAGDALQPEAFAMIANSSFTAENKIEAIRVLSSACGVDGMVSGQVLDTAYDINTEEGLLDLNYRKTGRMIMAAAELGCVASNMPQQTRSLIVNYAKNIGLAFQIQDDVLDVIGDEQIFGKSIGSDKNDGKTTFVDCLGIDNCKKKIEELTNIAINEIKDIKNNEFLTDFAYSLVGREL